MGGVTKSRKIDSKHPYQTFQLSNMKILLVLEMNITYQVKRIHLGDSLFSKILTFLYGIIQITETLER